jgi:hypothetical protein
MSAGSMAMDWLIIEKDIRTECCQESTLVHTTEEQRLIDSNVPGPECPDDTFVRRHTACSNQSCTDGRSV